MASWSTALALLTITFIPSHAVAMVSRQAIGKNGQGTLLFVGDSLTVGSDAFGSLATRVRGTKVWTTVVMDARVGRTARAGATTVSQKLTRHTTAIVIALGTNDMLSKPESWYPDWVINKVMRATKGRPVLWFTLEYSASARKDWRSRAARFNRQLKKATERWPQLTVADWNAFFVPNKVSRFIGDGVHLTVSGYQTRARYSLRVIQQFGQMVVDASTTTTSTSTSSSSTSTSTTTPPTTTSTSTTTSTTTTVAPPPQQ